jgi:DNA-binding winged helix-turn-helix (wHTH) protein
MRIRNSPHASDRIDRGFIGTDSGASEPRSASIQLLSPSTRTGQHQRNVRSRRVPSQLWSEMAELLTDINGLPVLVRLLIKDMPAATQSDVFSNENEIHSLLSNTLEKMVDRVRGSSLQRDASPRPPLPIAELTSSEDPLARRPELPNETVVRVGPLELDLLDRTAKRGDRKIDLRPREFTLLKYMMQRSDNLLTRATLLKEVWRYKFVPETNLVDVHMGRLRRKVDASSDPPMIRNVRGVGFVLSATPCALNTPSKPAQRSGSVAVADQSPRSVARAAP